MRSSPTTLLICQVWCGAAGILLGPGCQQGDTPPLGTVTGVVTLNGEPLAGAAILFALDEGGRPAAGITREDGTYQLEYTSTRSGAPVGQHVVRISTGKEGNSTVPEVPEQLPSKYHSQSELTAMVNAGQNKIDFALEAAPLPSKAKKGNPQSPQPETQSKLKD